MKAEIRVLDFEEREIETKREETIRFYCFEIIKMNRYRKTDRQISGCIL